MHCGTLLRLSSGLRRVAWLAEQYAVLEDVTRGVLTPQAHEVIDFAARAHITSADRARAVLFLDQGVASSRDVSTCRTSATVSGRRTYRSLRLAVLAVTRDQLSWPLARQARLREGHVITVNQSLGVKGVNVLGEVQRQHKPLGRNL